MNRDVVNAILKKGEIPETLKEAQVHSLPKIWVQQNWRTNTPRSNFFWVKIIEKVVGLKLQKALESMDGLDSWQSGSDLDVGWKMY